MSRLTQGRRAAVPIRGCHPLRPAFPDGSGNWLTVTGLVRFRSPLLTESRLMSFPPATEMFQFAGFASATYGFSRRYRSRGGLPHSEIPGSTSARLSPGLFAACHVLHRLSVPRHPPDALTHSLDRSTRRLQGQAPQSNKVSHEDTLLLKKPSAVSAQPPALSYKLKAISQEQGRSPSSHSLFTLSNSNAGRTRPPANPNFTRSTRTAKPGAYSLTPTAELVEANGIEPSTSCLQSRRSPN